MSFKDNLLNDAKNTFLNTSELAEEISYTPLDQDSKTINAIVVRESIELGSEDQGRILQKQCQIYIANDETAGVDSINKNGDIVSFPIRIGEDAVDWAIVDILKKDEGMWHLLMQR